MLKSQQNPLPRSNIRVGRWVSAKGSPYSHCDHAVEGVEILCNELGSRQCGAPGSPLGGNAVDDHLKTPECSRYWAKAALCRGPRRQIIEESKVRAHKRGCGTCLSLSGWFGVIIGFRLGTFLNSFG